MTPEHQSREHRVFEKIRCVSEELRQRIVSKVSSQQETTADNGGT